MEWLKFGRAMVAIIVSSGVMWTIVNPSTPLLAANWIIGATFIVAALLSVQSLLEYFERENNVSDFSALAEELQNSTNSDTGEDD